MNVCPLRPSDTLNPLICKDDLADELPGERESLAAAPAVHVWHCRSPWIHTFTISENNMRVGLRQLSPTQQF